MSDPLIVLDGGTLKLIGLWSSVLAYAAATCVEANEGGASPIAPMRIALNRVELQEGRITLQFERRVGGRNNTPETCFMIAHTVPRLLFDVATTPEAWMLPIRGAVQQLAAQVPALGVAFQRESR